MADAGRVIAGTARGIRLAAPGTGTRPLTDRVKQTLFADARARPRGRRRPRPVRGQRRGCHRGAVARRGARGPRGEGRRAPAGRSRRTCAARGSRTDARVVRRDVVTWLADPAGAAADAPFDLVLVDPPYADTTGLVRALELVGPHVRDGGAVIAKHFWRDAPPARVGMLASERERRFGETTLTFYRRTDEEAGEA